MNPEDFDPELQRELLDEVPAPGESFWDGVDARLTAAAAAEPATTAVDALESNGIVASGREDDTVIDLSGSRDAAQSRSSKMSWLLAAAVAVIVAGLIGFFTLGDSQTSEVDITDDSELPQDNESPEDPDNNDDTAPDQAQTNEVTWTQVGGDIAGPTSTGIAGNEVALSGDGNTVAVRYPVPNNAGSAGSRDTRVFRWDGEDWAQLGADIIDNDAEVVAFISVALSADGNTLVLGDDYSEVENVRIFRWDGEAWVPFGTIDRLAEDGDTQRLGASVAVSADGETIVVGDPGASNFGAVSVYRWTGNSWSELGTAVSVSNLVDAIAVSADGTSFIASGSRNGTANVFRWDDLSEWVQVGSRLSGDEEAAFGDAVAMSADGNTVIIGAPLGHNSSVFRLIDGEWSPLGAIEDQEVSHFGEGIGFAALFGESVGITGDGNTVIVGGTTQGAESLARTFIWDGSNWNQFGPDFVGEDGSMSSGGTVAISADGNTALLNFGLESSGATTVDEGRIRVFRSSDAPVASNASTSAETEPTVDATAPADAPPVTETDVAEETTTTTALEAEAESAAAVTYRCFDPTFGAGDPSTDSWIVEFAGDDFVSLEEFPDIEGAASVISIGTLSPDGFATVRSTILPDGRTRVGDWFFGEAELWGRLADETPAPEIDCSQLDNFDALVDQLAADYAALQANERARNIVDGGRSRVATANFGSDSPRLTLTNLPGDTTEIGTIGAGLHNVPSSGRTATVDGVGYTEIIIPRGNNEQAGWIRSDMLDPEPRSVAAIARARSGGVFGVIEGVSEPGEDGLYSIRVEGQEFFFSPTATLDDRGVIGPGLTLNELLSIGIPSGVTIEFVVSPEFTESPTITNIRVVGFPAG